MICSNCATQNLPDTKFCIRCGFRLACPTCGAPIVQGARFCGNCGTRLTTEDAPGVEYPPVPNEPYGTPVVARATERRVVTVLFADLVGFTTLSSTRDPETIRELQSRYFERSREIVIRYGGVVEKYIGDAVMALWGAPTAREDDAERAVRAALDLVEMVPLLGAELGVELRLRAGVLTGEAAVEVGAESEGMVAGDIVNTAARLQSAAEPGTVLVGEATRLAAGKAIAFEPAGEQVLKGKASPVPAWRALRVVAERGGARRPDAIEAPFVGRAEELRFLKEQFHATGREGRTRLVSLVGQAGIGKSRLAWELEKYLDGLVETVWWHRGRSPSYGEGLTFWALTEMFRRRAGLAEGADPEETRRAVAEMLQRHVPDEAERAWMEPRILVLLGEGDAPQGGSAELFAAWRTFFERLATNGTVALVVEDLQWSDDGLLDFLEHILDWGRSSPILVLTLARPELLERRPGWGTDRRGATAMHLDPLPDPSMRELLEGLAPGLPEGVVGRILERANGIPLYAVETVRMLVAKGQLIERDGRLEPSQGSGRGALDLKDLEVPPTLHALVAARLDALPPADRLLLRDAAILGQTFSVDALAAMTGESPAQLAPRLAALTRREILTLDTDPRAPTRGQHAFVQALLREVAFGTLSRRERRARHLAAARYFESLGDDEVAGVVATHFVEAFRAAPDGPEGEAVATQARISLLASAGRAQELGAPRQAIDAYRSAVEVTPDAAQRADLLVRMGIQQSLTSQWEECYASFRTAADLYAGLGDPTNALRARVHLLREHLSAARLAEAATIAATIREEAELLVARALEKGAEAEGEGAEVAALFAEAMARLEFRRAELDEAIRWSDMALSLAEPMLLDELIAMALVTKGTGLMMSGQLRQGVAVLEGANVDATARGHHLPALRALNNLASGMVEVDPRASLERTKQGMAMARRLGLLAFDVYHAANAVGAAEQLGEWAWLRETVERMQDVDREPDEADRLATLHGYMRAWTGDPDTARGQQQLVAAIHNRDFQVERDVSFWLARCAFAAGDSTRAVELSEPFFRDAGPRRTALDFGSVGRFALHAGRLDRVRRALDIIGRGSGGVQTHEIQAVQAGLAALEGRRDEALELYRQALAGYRTFGTKLLIALTALDMATFLGPEDPAVAPVLDEGRAIIEELDARLLLDRLDALGPSNAGRAGVLESEAPASAATPVGVPVGPATSPHG